MSVQISKRRTQTCINQNISRVSFFFVLFRSFFQLFLVASCFVDDSCWMCALLSLFLIFLFFCFFFFFFPRVHPFQPLISRESFARHFFGMQDVRAVDERVIMASFFGVNESGVEVEVELQKDALVISAKNEAPKRVTFDYLISYDGHPWKHEGPQWVIDLRSVSWRWILLGKTFSSHSIKLVPPKGFQTTDLNIDRAYCLEVLYSLDKTVLQWMRQKVAPSSASIAVSSVSLLRPQVGVEAALMTIKRESESDESGLEFLGNNLADMSVSAKQSRNSPRVEKKNCGRNVGIMILSLFFERDTRDQIPATFCFVILKLLKSRDFASKVNQFDGCLRDS